MEYSLEGTGVYEQTKQHQKSSIKVDILMFHSTLLFCGTENKIVKAH